MRVTIEHLRRYAVARSLFKPTTLGRAIKKLGFVQADPIRAPARAQDLTLRHRVAGYSVGDLERLYPKLAIEEDFFVNYGFLAREHHRLMHPRAPKHRWPRSRRNQAAAVLEFIRERGSVHPRAVDAHFEHGKVINWFGGTSNATTHLLDDMHYRGFLRVARRAAGTRVYSVGSAVHAPATLSESSRFDLLVDVVMRTYAPLPAASLGQLVSLLIRGVPQWSGQRAAALARAKQRFARIRLQGVDWYWPAGESPASARWQLDDKVRLLTPFDPVVWDRRRFQIFWQWTYRFEAYTPPSKRKLGYYALPLLWRDAVIGWANLSVAAGLLHGSFGYVAGRAPPDAAFHTGLEEEMAHLGAFLKLAPAADQPAQVRRSPVSRWTKSEVR